jgi:hypothetical protein
VTSEDIDGQKQNDWIETINHDNIYIIANSHLYGLFIPGFIQMLIWLDVATLLVRPVARNLGLPEPGSLISGHQKFLFGFQRLA